MGYARKEEVAKSRCAMHVFFDYRKNQKGGMKNTFKWNKDFQVHKNHSS